MKLIALCLFATCCFSLSDATKTNQRRKLEEVLRQLNDVKEILQHDEKMLNTPPEDIQDCCCKSALQCFRTNLLVHFNVTEKKQKKLYKSLQHQLTVAGLNFCDSANETPTCEACDSHPKAKAQTFFINLQSLIQRGITRLSMN